MLEGLLALMLVGEPATWVTKEVKNPMDDKTTLVMSKGVAEGQIVNSAGTPADPVLHVRCSSGAADLMVYTGTMGKLAPSLRNSTGMRLRFDSDPPRITFGRVTNDHESVGITDRWVLDRLLTAGKLLLEFTPVGASTQNVTFDVTGLKDVVMPHAATCGIDPTEIGDPGEYVVVVRSLLDEEPAKALAKKIADKLKVETGIAREAHGLNSYNVWVGHFPAREDALALLNKAREKKAPNADQMLVGKINTKRTRMLDEPL